MSKKRKQAAAEYLRGQDLLDKAIEIAKKAHRGQKRKYSDKPYIIHPEAVAEQMTDPVHKAIAYLHDVIEDSNYTLEDLIKEKIGPPVIDAVNALTKRKEEDYLDYILRVKENAYAITVKLADLKHNLEDTKKGTLRDKYMLTTYILTHNVGENVQKALENSV